MGALSGLVMGLLWFFFTLLILGYGDSGPSWLNTVDDWLLGAGILIGILGGQILFFADRKRKGEETKQENQST